MASTRESRTPTTTSSPSIAASDATAAATWLAALWLIGWAARLMSRYS
jgi:hypothetical protein